MPPLTADLLKKIRRIQFQTTQLTNDVFAGAYRSAFKGQGMEFEDDREYQPGDDIRTIDWNVTAHMNRLFVKSFREERDLTVTLVVDISASTRFGSQNQLKSDLITEVAGVLAFSAIKNNDRVALLLYSDTVELYLPPKKGLRHVLRVIRELLAHTPQHSGTNPAAALAYLGKVQRRSSICFIISDFICPDFSHEVALIAKRHDLIAIAVVDPSETSFPAMNLVSFKDAETGTTHIIDTSSRSTQQYLQESLKDRLTKLNSLMKKVGADLVTLRTDKPYAISLRKFFKIRAKRRA